MSDPFMESMLGYEGAVVKCAGFVTSKNKAWVGGPNAPEMLALPERGGGGGLSYARTFFGDLSTMHLGPSEVIIYHQKVIISPPKVCLVPRIDHLTT